MISKTKQVLKEPKLPINIPSNSQWLAGEGAGSWFSINIENEYYKICRYNAFGITECEGEFEVAGIFNFNINISYKFTYLSHCQQVKIIQNDLVFTFNRISN